MQFEPQHALVSGLDGLDAIREITTQAQCFLQPMGYLLFEHGYDQAYAVQQILHQHGFSAIETVKDLAGQARVTLGQT